MKKWWRTCCVEREAKPLGSAGANQFLFKKKESPNFPPKVHPPPNRGTLRRRLPVTAAMERSSYVAAVFSLLLFLFGTAASTTPFFSCSPTNAIAPGSAYYANLRSVLSSIPAAATPSHFANLSFGSAPDRVYAIALCRADTNSSLCLSCLTTAVADAPILCPGSRSAAVFYDLCRLRFSDTRFFSSLTPDPPNPFFFSYDLVADMPYFSDQIGRLLANLRDRAAFGNETGLYASGWVDYGDGETLFGLVQCSRDLSRETCAQCLEEPIRRIACCWSSVDLTYQGGSCYLRYAFRLFFNASVGAPPRVQRNRSSSAAIMVPPQPEHGGGNIIPMIVGIVVGAILLVLVVLIAIRAKRKTRRGLVLGRRSIDQEENGRLMFGRLSSRKISAQMNSRHLESRTLDLHKLDLQMMKVATDNFSDAKRIGKGEFGSTYKGDLPGQQFVVKRITAIPHVEVEVIKREFKSFTRLEHPNILRMLTCHLGEENLLLYEYMPNDSLDGVLFDNKKKVLLDWGRRFKIIQGVAQGLLYLHGDSGMNVTHRNLKASNVLLDKHMVPKISGFCLPKFFTACEAPAGNRKPANGSGYMAPESLANGIYTAKTDVFSYGVLVLEIITGQRNRALVGNENAVTLLKYVWQYWKDDRAVHVLDWSLGELYKKHEVLRCIHVGLLCVQEDQEKRPGLSAIVHMLSSFSFTPPTPSSPATVRLGNAKTVQKEETGDSGHWDWKMNQAGGQVIPR